MKIFKKLGPLLFLFGISIFLFWKVFFLGEVFYEGDNFHLNIPAKYFLVEEITHGRLPLWNPYLFTGVPYLADLNLGTFNPLNIFYFLFPVPHALTFITILDYFFIALFEYFFLRSLKLSKISSLLGAIVFAYGGMPFNLIGNMTFVNVVVYIPLLFWMVYSFTTTKKIKYFLLLLLFEAMQFIAGHPQTTFYTMLFISTYLFFFTKFSWKKKTLFTSLYVTIPLILAAVQLIPFIEYALHANRPITNIDYASWGNLSPVKYITFLFPLIFGNHVDGNWWGSQQLLIGYIGIPSLVLLFVGLWKMKWKEKLFPIIGIVLTLTLAMGKLTPIFYLFYYLIPGWRFFRAPSGIITMYTFFAAFIAAFGLEYLRKNPLYVKMLAKKVLYVLLPFTLFLTALYIYSQKPFFWENLLIFTQTHLSVQKLSAFLIYDHIKIQGIFDIVLGSILFLTIFTLLSFISLFFLSKKKYIGISFLIMTLGSLLLVDRKIVLTAKDNLYDSNKNIPTVLQTVEKGNFRILSETVNFHHPRASFAGPEFFYKEALANLVIYKGDNNIERHLSQVNAYASLIPKSYALFIAGEKNSSNVTGIDFDLDKEDVLSQSSIKYILSHEKLSDKESKDLSLVTAKNNAYYIYDNKNALPRVYILDGKKEEDVSIRINNPSYIKLVAHIVSKRSLILTDWYYPGWEAYVNNKRVAVQVYKDTFRKITIPQGNSEIVFVYRPMSIIVGSIISVLSLSIFCLLYLFIRNKKV